MDGAIVEFDGYGIALYPGYCSDKGAVTGVEVILVFGFAKDTVP